MNGMIIVRDKDTLIRVLETTEEKIEVNAGTVMQTYFNPDSNNGCQIVVNIWDKVYMMSHVGKCENDVLIDRSIETSTDNDLEADADQRLYDIELNDDGTIDFVDIVEEYIDKPIMSYKTLTRLKEEFDKVKPAGIMGHSYNVGVTNYLNTELSCETQGDLVKYASIDVAWSEFFNWLLQDMHEMGIGPYAELSITYVEDAGDAENDDKAENTTCCLVNRVAEEIRSFDPYSFADAGTMEENSEQIHKDIYEDEGKETLRSLKEIIDFEKENNEDFAQTQKVYQDVITEVAINKATNVEPSTAASVMADILMDEDIYSFENTYKMFDNLKMMYSSADEKGRKYIDRTLEIITGKNITEIAEEIASAE